MRELEIEAKGVKDAIKLGLLQLGIAEEEATIKILDEGSSGLFGLGAKPAKVLITKKSLNKADTEYAINKAKETVKELFSRLNISLDKISAKIENDFINIEIATPDGALVIGKGGQTLDALEYILQLILNNDPRSRLKVNLDTENYRKKQYERLEILAQKALSYVKRTGKIYRFDPMCAKERKIIHSYLKSFPEIETFSDGTGAARKVAIKRAAK